MAKTSRTSIVLSLAMLTGCVSQKESEIAQKPTLNLNDSLNGSGYQTNEELSTIRGSSSNPKALEGNL